MLKIKGVLVNLLVQLAPEVYGPYVVFENGHLTGAFFPMVCIFPKFSLSLAQISPDRESCDNEL
jgi:hypothetical protein